jgi:tetratricopeptide (TPR) repeat protein
MDDTYFQKDRDTKLKDKFDEILALVESEHANHGKCIASHKFKLWFIGDDNIKKSEYLSLKAKAMDFMPEHQVDAKTGLEQAVELNPENQEAIRDLGVVYYKLKDYEKAAENYIRALELKENDLKCLGYYSITMRALPTKTDEQKEENLEKGIELAKKAVGFGVANSHSWYLLGNAYMTSFFMTERFDNLDKSLKAYQQAENTQKDHNPDLYFNRATIYTYFERYSEAIRDFIKANTIDPGLNADDKATKLCEFVIGTVRMIEHKKNSKNKALTDLVKSIPKKVGEVKFLSTKETEQTLKYKLLPQSEMDAGENMGVIYCGKVICQIHKEPGVPACFLCVDSKFNYTVMSLYNINKNIKEKIKYGDEVLIRDPVLYFISIEYEGKLMTYPSIRVINLSDILINEQTLADVYSKATAISGDTPA